MRHRTNTGNTIVAGLFHILCAFAAIGALVKAGTTTGLLEAIFALVCFSIALQIGRDGL